MFQLAYASAAARRFDEDDLSVLVERAREKNQRLGVTGVLVYRNGSFLQVLEGDEETVRALYDTIRADARHDWVMLLKASSLAERDFPQAPLAFRDRSLAGHEAGATLSEDDPARNVLSKFQRADGPTASRSRSATRTQAAPGQVSPDQGSASEAAAS